MLCLTKKNVQAIHVISILTLLFFSFIVVAQGSVSSKFFNQVTDQVIKLKKIDLAASLKKLMTLENQLNTLTVEQNLLYYKLLAEIQSQQNQYTLAKTSATKGLKLSKNLVSPNIFISKLLYLKGLAYEGLGDFNQASQEYKKGLEVAESLFDNVQIASGLINLGSIDKALAIPTL